MELKPYPKYKDSGIEWLGQIPQSWDLKPIKFIKDKSANSFVDGPFGSNLKSIHFVDEGDVFVIESEFATRGTFDETKLKQITFEHFQSIKRSQTREGDIIIAKIGANFGLSNILPPLSKEAVVSGNSMKLTVNKEISFTKFIYYQLLAMKLNGAIDLLAGTTAQPALSLSKMNSFKIALPGFVDQQLISAFLDYETTHIDSLIAKKKRQIELLHEKRAALISHAVTKGIDPNVPMKDSGIEWLGEIPKHWKTSHLDQIVETFRKITYGIVQPGENDPNGSFMVRGQDYSRGWAHADSIFKVSPSIEKPYKRSRLKSGDIIMTIVGAGVGNIAIVPDWLNGANITQTTARIAVSKKYGINRYFAYLLSSKIGKVNIDLTMKGAAQPGLNLGHVCKYSIIIPPKEEQEKIADYLDKTTEKIDSLISKIQLSIDKLREYRTALISAAVTGKIDVRDFQNQEAN